MELLNSRHRSVSGTPVAGHSPTRCVTCGLLCVKQIALSEANYGRKFYCCKSKYCKFFVCWEDAIPTTSVGDNSLVTTTKKKGFKSAHSPIRCVTCGLLCIKQIALTKANYGRKFYCCKSKDCKFFVCWEDTIPTTNVGNNNLVTTTSKMGLNSGDSSIRCATCGLLCDLITIAKGPNKGRKFYCCESEDCVLFVCWQDSIPATSGGDNGLATTASIMGANSNKGHSPIQCVVCGFLCVLRAVIAGPNQGIKFYSCETTEDCMFFVRWEDSIPTTSGDDNNLATTTSIMGVNSNNGDSPIQCAVCGFLCVLRAVIAGPNQGRIFYSCEKTKDCMFFVCWEDSNSIPTTRDGGSSSDTSTS